MTFGEQVISFYKKLKIETALPEGVSVLHPYKSKQTLDLTVKFYNKYYGDENERVIILGINPGRFGGGLTGVPFTDPIKLETICGIPNELDKKAELSAEFIHTMIAAYGGVDKFFGRFYINSVCPLGFVQNGKNLNYYDIRDLQDAVGPFILKSLKQQLKFGVRRDIAYCLGEGENYKYLIRLNEQHQFFQEIIPLAHPRFIMQYKRKYIEQYVQDYLKKLGRIP